MKARLIVAVAVLAFFSTIASSSSENKLPFPIGYDALDFQNALPIFRDLALVRETSSHDRRGGNDNGFTNKAEFVRRKGLSGSVLLDVEGPGAVYSFWYSWPNHPILPKFVEPMWLRKLGNFKVFLNSSDTPLIDVPANDLTANPPHTFPLAVTGKQSTGGIITYAPIPFEKGVKITLDGGAVPMFFYHTWWHAYPFGSNVVSYTGNERLDPSLAKTLTGPAEGIALESLRSATNIVIPAGAEKEVLLINGAGVIRSFRMKLPENDKDLRNIRVVIKWDGEKEPSVNTPVSLLYAVENRFRTEPAAIAENAPLGGPVIGKDADGFYYFNLPMPFNRSAQITLANDNDEAVEIAEVRLDLDPRPFHGLGSSAGYFKTKFNSSDDLVVNRDYEFARLEGRGHIVGTVLAVEDTSETFLEGDERVYIDGSRSPQVMGDATETYFNGSWYFTERAFSCPFHGAPTFRMYDKKPGSRSDITMYRFHLTDLVPFRSEARFTIQHGPANNVPGHYRSVVFYYGMPEKILEQGEIVSVGHDMAKFPKAKTGFFEGEFNGNTLGLKKRPEWISPIGWVLLITAKSATYTAKKSSPDAKRFAVVRHTEPFDIVARISPNNNGVLLRRLLDQSIPDQRATIEIDGQPAGVWYNAGRNKWKIWADDDIMIGPWFTQGKDKIRIRITPTSDVFTATEFRVYSLIKPKEKN